MLLLFFNHFDYVKKTISKSNIPLTNIINNKFNKINERISLLQNNNGLNVKDIVGIGISDKAETHLLNSLGIDTTVFCLKHGLHNEIESILQYFKQNKIIIDNNIHLFEHCINNIYFVIDRLFQPHSNYTYQKSKDWELYCHSKKIVNILSHASRYSPNRYHLNLKHLWRILKFVSYHLEDYLLNNGQLWNDCEYKKILEKFVDSHVLYEGLLLSILHTSYFGSIELLFTLMDYYDGINLYINCYNKIKNLTMIECNLMVSGFFFIHGKLNGLLSCLGVENLNLWIKYKYLKNKYDLYQLSFDNISENDNNTNNIEIISVKQVKFVRWYNNLELLSLIIGSSMCFLSKQDNDTILPELIMNYLNLTSLKFVKCTSYIMILDYFVNKYSTKKLTNFMLNCGSIIHNISSTWCNSILKRTQFFLSGTFVFKSYNFICTNNK